MNSSEDATQRKPSSAEFKSLTSIEAEIKREPNPIRKFLRVLGPGFITGASDDDPSGIGTYAVAGASLGYSTLWTALLTFPLMTCVQFTCAKIGMVTGKGIASVIREHYPKQILYGVVFTLLAANTINAGADIGAIAAAVNLLLPIPVLVSIIPITVVILLLQVLGSYRLIVSTFRWLTLTLFAYVASAFLAKPNFTIAIRETVYPHIVWSGKYLSILVAILGTTISPYLFFWQATHEVEEEISRGRKQLRQRTGATKGELRYAAWDVNIGMFFSNVVMYFIIFATAATLFRTGKTEIQTASEAAQALEPLAGHLAKALLAKGLIGSGFLAVPVLTGSSAYALSEAFGWKHGLNRKPRHAREFYVLIVLSTFVGMLINFMGINPIKALVWTAIINGVLAPPLLMIVMFVANNHEIMGNRTNGWVMNVLGWVTTALMATAAIALMVTYGR